MVVTKFIEPWLLPPGLLLIFLVVVAVVLRRRQARAWSMVSAVVALAFYASSTSLVSDAVLGSLERAVPGVVTPTSSAGIGETGAQAIVVLGGGVVAPSPAEDGGGALTVEAESRVVYGYRLARATDLPVVVTGGVVFPRSGLPPEADVAASFLRELGLPEDRILVEADARTTAENAVRTRDRFGFHTVIVVTSAYHMRRAILAFEQAGIGALPAPAAFRTAPGSLTLNRLLPSAEAFRNTTTWWREQIGYAWYRLRRAR